MFMVENVLDMKYEGIISGLHAYIGGLLAKFLPFLSIHFSFAYPKCNPIFYWHHLSDFKQRNKVVLYSVLRNIKPWRMIACIWFPTLKTGVMKIIPFLENLHIITYIYLCVFIVFFIISSLLYWYPLLNTVILQSTDTLFNFILKQKFARKSWTTCRYHNFV